MNISVGGGSGGALMGALGAVLAAGGADGAAGAAATGNPMIGQFMSGVAAAGVAAEAASGAGNSGFNAAGGHFAEGGKSQQGAAANIGGILSSIMPMSGIVSSVIEKFKSSTIGIAKTEQIGVFKNTSVGHSMTTQVGDTKIVTVGQKFQLQCGVNLLVIEAGGGDGKNSSKDPHITLKSGDTQITINPTGVFTTAGKIQTIASGEHKIKGQIVKINT